MKKIIFYLLFPFIYLIASLPFPVLYKVSSFLYYILKMSGYRKKVVLTNLQNAFPEKSGDEIRAICDRYYRYLTDLILETLKTLKMTEKQALERCRFNNTEWLDQLYREKKSIIIVMGHYGNWEWAGPSFTLTTKFQLNVIYRPLSDPYFEKMMTGMRTRFGTRITPQQLTLREMVASRHEITATALVADQTATPQNAYWMNFLNQDTAVYEGPDKLAKKFNYPVVYMNAKRIRRGYYEVTPELLFNTPKNTADNEICDAFMKRLEQEIKLDPVTWLWSHRRWKHKRTA
ncbi:MAG: lysophospholipid acyltransferase family protein [Bacteroidota bacterium]